MESELGMSHPTLDMLQNFVGFRDGPIIPLRCSPKLSGTLKKDLWKPQSNPLEAPVHPACLPRVIAECGAT